MPRNAFLPALALFTAVGGAAFAQSPTTPAQAQALEAQITAWLKQVTAGLPGLPARPVQLTAQGDHFGVRVPLAPLGNITPADAAVTADARAMDGNRWSVENQQFPSDLTLTTTEMVPNDPNAKDPASDAKHAETVRFHLVLGKQDAHGVFDPSYSAPTNSSGTVESISLEKTGGIGKSTSHINRVSSQSSTQPTDPQHINLLGDGTAEGYTIKADMADGSAFEMSVDRIHVTSALSGLAHDHIVPIIETMGQLARLSSARTGGAAGANDTASVGAAGTGSTGKGTIGGGAPGGGKSGSVKGGNLGNGSANGGSVKGGVAPGPSETADAKNTPTPAELALLRTMLVKANGLLAGAKVDESMEGVKFDFGVGSGTLDKAMLSFGLAAPQDNLTADMGFAMDGLKVNGLPPNLVDYVPTHFSIHPMVSNISVSALTKLGMDATAPDAGGTKAPAPNFQTVFANGGINVGFDRLALEIPGTSLEGSGQFVSTGPESFTGQAQFTARGLDTLVTKMQADPMLAPGVPVVIFLKGIARTNADQAVWQVTMNNAKILVNGVDISALGGSATK